MGWRNFGAFLIQGLAECRAPGQEILHALSAGAFRDDVPVFPDWSMASAAGCARRSSGAVNAGALPFYSP